MTEKEFEGSLKCKFSCNYDPKDQKPFEHQFKKEKFVAIDSANNIDYLFKMACKSKIDELVEQEVD